LLHRSYPASSLIRAPPPPRTARPGPRGLSVEGHAPPPPRLLVLRRISLCRHATANTPVEPWSVSHREGLSLLSPGRRPSPYSNRVGFHIALFRGLHGVHLRCGLPARRAAKAARCLEGFDGFVTSAAAPIATGWSDQLSGRESHPLKIRAFSRRTATGRRGWPRRSGVRSGCECGPAVAGIGDRRGE
jgi:hypothetical protein